MPDMDMVPPGDRSIRNIPLSRTQHYSEPSGRPPRRRSYKRVWMLGFFVVVLCAIAGLALSTVFEKTTVTLYPHQVAVTPTQPLIAYANPVAGALGYSTFSLTRSASTTSSVSGTQKVSKYASGSVTIYNTYSTAPQKLIANTRFQAPDGKIYRIHSTVTVPGEAKTASGAQPGSVSAVLYADQPGPAYNRTEPTRFTIPGFKGDAKYNNFYAQSQNPLTGGFVGDQAVISSADLAAASKTLKQSLDTAIVQAARDGTVPAGYVIAPGTLQVSYSDVSQTPNSDASVTLTQSANARASMVKVADLASALARQTITEYKGEPVQFKDPAQLSMSAGSTTPAGQVSIVIAGPITLQWMFDKDVVKDALIGKNRASFDSIIKAFRPGIEKADAKIRPFWKSSFPTDPNRIDVVLAAGSAEK